MNPETILKQLIIKNLLYNLVSINFKNIFIRSVIYYE